MIAPHPGEAQQDSLGPKSRYNLFHRTPKELRRPLATDRPDRTESPYTVDAGLFQAEIDLFTYGSDASADGEPGVQSNSYSFLPFNIKAGLTHNIDLQFVLQEQVFRADALALHSRDVDLAGSGTLATATKALDGRFDISLSEALSAQAGNDLRRYTREGSRVVLPATVRGTLETPRVTIDTASALKRGLRNEVEGRLKGLLSVRDAEVRHHGRPADQ